MASDRQPLSGLPLMILLTLANAASMSWFGYDQGVFSGVLISSDFKSHFPQVNKANVSGITSSCFSLGAFIGCIAAFVLGDKLGRKRTIYFGLLANVIGAVLQVSSYQLPQMIVGRLINGFGMGLTSSTCPVYQAECSKPRVRGKLIVVTSVCNTAAFCLANWINFGLYAHKGPFQWRFPLAFQLIFPIIVTPILPFLCESPRWLLIRDRTEDALLAISRLYGVPGQVDNPAVLDEYKSIFKALQDERADVAAAKDVFLFRDRTQNLRRLLLSCGTQLMQQFTGVNALGYYLPTLLEQSVGLSEETARLLTACNATSYLAAACVCLMIIDKVGRRKLMLYGSLTCGTCYLIAAVTLKEASLHPSKKNSLGSATTAMFFMYYFFYGTSYAKVPWVFNSEINSLGWRVRGAAAATATNWMGSFIVTQFTKVGVDNLHWGFYLLFACFCYSYFPIVFSIYPETSRRTLEDMDEIFTTNPGWFVAFKPILTQRERPREFVEAERRRIEAAEEVLAAEAKGEGKALGGDAKTSHVETQLDV